MSDELKPCPFCGGEAVFNAHATANDIGNGVVCRTLAVIECPRCEFCIAQEADDEAAAAWNARAERTCHITDVHDFRDGSRTFFLSCGHQRHGERGTRFRYCDVCGAKVAAPSERTCHMNHVLLYDEEGVEGIECDECGWEDIHDWNDPLPERCPGCGAKVVGK